MLLSIVVVTFNCARILPETLLSIARFSEQFNGELEVICVDGASSDDTLNVIEGSELFSKILSEPDLGIFDAMNKGAELSSGHWICYMNAGDSFSDFSGLDIAEVLTNMRPVVGVVYGDTDVVFEGDYIVRKKSPSFVTKNATMPFCHQSCFTRKELVELIKFDIGYPRVADQKFYYEVFNRGCEFSYVDSVFSLVEAEGFSSNQLLKTATEELSFRLNLNVMSPFKSYYKFYLKCIFIFVKSLTPSSVRKIKRNFYSG
ncbi:glycosyltransferase [Motilimonas cestriensis]|uniref:glycosyltransferase n=1 Tax=Motilimonas cestriensis TaxID=2742685 RepID=UPI003DA3A640